MRSESRLRPAASSPEDTENDRSQPNRSFHLQGPATIFRSFHGCGSAAHIYSVSPRSRLFPQKDEDSGGRSPRSLEALRSVPHAVPEVPYWLRDEQCANENRTPGTAKASAGWQPAPPHLAEIEGTSNRGSNRHWPERSLPHQLD